MNHTTRFAIVCLSLVFALTANAKKPTREKLANRIVTAEYVLEEVMANPDTAIPSAILQDAHGIILTVNYRGGFFVGGHGGQGILIAKNPITKKWGVPAFVKTGGANLGIQFGLKEFDAVYIIMDLDAVRKAYTGRFDLSADAAAVAGPLYRSKEAHQSIDYKNAKLLVYTSKKGLFAGVALKAGWISPSNKATQTFYNTDYKLPEIVMSDWFELPIEATALLQRLNYYTEGGR